MLIDTHAHLNFKAFENDLNSVIKRSFDNNIGMINIGTNYQTSKKAVEISLKYKKAFASVGLHPISLDTELVKKRIDPSEFNEKEYPFEKGFNYSKYKDLIIGCKKIVAIGEIGLDYWYKPKSKNKQELFKQEQKEILIKQFELAKELNLPVILHCRLAHNDLFEIIKTKDLKGVIHCFTGDWKEAKEYLDLGFCIGLNGIIFKLNLDEIIKKIPLEKILLETDCPYLTPPQEKDKRNEPIYIKYIVQKVAEIKNVSFQEVLEITTENAKKVFKLKCSEMKF